MNLYKATRSRIAAYTILPARSVRRRRAIGRAYRAQMSLQWRRVRHMSARALRYAVLLARQSVKLLLFGLTLLVTLLLALLLALLRAGMRIGRSGRSL